jgi:c-di-GMP-binding flagellar brake protein YcgR
MSILENSASGHLHELPPDDRRSTTRFMIEQLVEVSFDREIFIDATAIDLSLGGLRVQTAQRLEPDVHVFVIFKLTPREGQEILIPAECIVIHSKPNKTLWDIGLRFHEISAADRGFVKKILESSTY